MVVMIAALIKILSQRVVLPLLLPMSIPNSPILITHDDGSSQSQHRIDDPCSPRGTSKRDILVGRHGPGRCWVRSSVESEAVHAVDDTCHHAIDSIGSIGHTIEPVESIDHSRGTVHHSHAIIVRGSDTIPIDGKQLSVGWDGETSNDFTLHKDGRPPQAPVRVFLEDGQMMTTTVLAAFQQDAHQLTKLGECEARVVDVTGSL